MKVKTVAANKLKNKVYKKFIDHCEEQVFKLDSSSELSLLVPAGMYISQQELLEMVEKFLEGFECIIVIEPVTKFSDCLLKAGYREYYDDLPSYHAHILIKEEKYEVRQLKEKWFELVGKSKKRLFHCEPILKTIPRYIHYITKFFEDKYDANPIYSFLIKKQESKKEKTEVYPDEATSIFSRFKQSMKDFLHKVTSSRLFYKFFMILTLLISTSMAPFNSCFDKMILINQSNSPPLNCVK